MHYLIYIVILYPLSILSVFSRRHLQKITLALVLITYIAIFAPAYKTGVDWILYLKSYELDSEYTFEPGYLLLQTSASLAGVSFWIYASIIKSAFILIIFKLLKRYSPLPALNLISFIMLSPLLLNDTIRQQVAAAFVIVSILNINKGLFRFISIILLACLFHVSAFCALLIYPLYRSERARSLAISLSVLFFTLSLGGIGLGKIFLLSGLSQLSPLLQKAIIYVTNSETNLSLGHLIRILILGAFWLGWIRIRRKKDINPTQYELIKVCYCGAVAMIFYEMVFYDIETLWIRLREYFTLFFILYPTLLAREALPKNFKLIAITTSLYCAYAFFTFYKAEFFENTYYEYKNYFSYVFSPDYEYDRRKDQAVMDFWANWKPRGEK